MPRDAGTGDTSAGNAEREGKRRAPQVRRITEAGEVTEQVRDLGLTYPPDVYSLSHVALPFPVSDGLYGLKPDPTDNFGISLGALTPRGERGALIVNLDTLLRVSSNPFFPYLLDRVEEDLPAGTRRAQATSLSTACLSP